MTEKEMILLALKRIGYKIYCEKKDYLEFECSGYDSLIIEFDKDGKILRIYD